MAEDRKGFESAAPMPFGGELAKLENATVDQPKAIQKFKADEKKGGFSGYHSPYNPGYIHPAQSSSRQGANIQGQQ